MVLMMVFFSWYLRQVSNCSVISDMRRRVHHISAQTLHTEPFTGYLGAKRCMDNSSCFLQGKRAAMARRYPALLWGFFLCEVFSCFHTTGYDAYSFTTDGYGIFNVRTDVGACRTHEDGSGTNKSEQELIGRTETTTVALPAPPGDRNPGSSG